MLLLKNIELPSTHISCRFECFDFGGLCQTHALGRCLDWRSVFLMGIWVFLLSFNYYYFFSWSIVELQCCISFCYIAKWVRFFPFFFFFYSLPVSSVHGKNTGVGCHFLLWAIFPTQGSNQHLLVLLHWQAVSLPLAPALWACYFSGVFTICYIFINNVFLLI